MHLRFLFFLVAAGALASCDNATKAGTDDMSNVSTIPGKQPASRIQITTTSTDFKDICERVAGELAEVKSLARGDQDLHGIEAEPGHILMLQKVQVYFSIGVGLDQWAIRFIKSSGNERIMPGSEYHIDVSTHIGILERPKAGQVLAGRALHLKGNPHYWTNPENAIVIAQVMCASLSRLYPEHKAEFERGRDEFTAEIKSAIERWKKKMRPCRGRKIVTYHKSWTYFATFFGLKEAGIIEPRPGIPPSPAHVSSLMDMVKREQIRLVLSEPFYPLKMPRMVAEQSGAKFLVLATSVGGTEGTENYIKLIDRAVNKITQSFK